MKRELFFESSISKELLASGYDALEKKLHLVGADIKRLKE